MMIRGTRPRKNRIEVWCDDDELAKIKANAKDTSLQIFIAKLVLEQARGL